VRYAAIVVTRRALRGALLACGVLALACAAGGGCDSKDRVRDDSPRRKGASAKEVLGRPACEAYAEGYCRGLFRCDPSWFFRGYGDPARCEEAIQRYCSLELNAPSTGDTEDIIRACADGYGKTSCDDWSVRKFPSSCEPPGKLVDGASCGMHAQCENYLCRKASGTALCGRCDSEPHAGDPCALSSCERGLVCRSGICAKPSALGAICGSDVDCIGALSCRFGTCKEPAKLGEKCDPMWSGALGCASKRGERCVDGKCIPGEFKRPGDACTSMTQCAGGHCDLATAKCVFRPSLGEPCDLTHDESCLYPLICSAGKCSLPDVTVCK
jgi:hypothetical protein